MLVLSRRQDDRIVFPNLGITVEILKIAGRCVRIGIEAPDDVRVLRHELAEKEAAGAASADVAQTSRVGHALRNRLNRASIALQLAQKQLEMGRLEEADQTVAKVLTEFRSLDEGIERKSDVQSSMVRHHALLVEDDANESELLAGFLRLSGFEVTTASDGCDALDYLSGNARPDVVLLDMQMPRCDGPATISAIRGNPEYHGLRVFGVSGRLPAEMGVTIGPAGVDRWYRKPLNPETLVTEMHQDFDRVVGVGG